jgi:hypothetical protein
VLDNPTVPDTLAIETDVFCEAKLMRNEEIIVALSRFQVDK